MFANSALRVVTHYTYHCLNILYILTTEISVKASGRKHGDCAMLIMLSCKKCTISNIWTETSHNLSDILTSLGKLSTVEVFLKTWKPGNAGSVEATEHT